MTWYVSLELLGLIFLAAQEPANGVSKNTTVTSGTLIVIGSTATDLVIATDSKATWRKGPTKTGPKIFKISEFSACIVNYDVSVTVTEGNRIIDKIDFVELLKGWTRQYQESSVAATHESLVSLYSERMANFFSRHRHSPPPPIHVGLVCLGYDYGNPVVASADIYSSFSKDLTPSVHKGSWNPQPGFFVPLGESQVCNDLLQESSQLFPAFRRTVVIQEYYNLKRNGNLGTILTDDMLQLSKACLEATESKEALSFDPHASLVGAPNHYAVISRRDGFRDAHPP